MAQAVSCTKCGVSVLHLGKCDLIIQEVMKVVVLQHGISKAMRGQNVEEILQTRVSLTSQQYKSLD